MHLHEGVMTGDHHVPGAIPMSVQLVNGVRRRLDDTVTVGRSDFHDRQGVRVLIVYRVTDGTKENSFIVFPTEFLCCSANDDDRTREVLQSFVELYRSWGKPEKAGLYESKLTEKKGD